MVFFVVLGSLFVAVIWVPGFVFLCGCVCFHGHCLCCVFLGGVFPVGVARVERCFCLQCIRFLVVVEYGLYFLYVLNVPFFFCFLLGSVLFLGFFFGGYGRK